METQEAETETETKAIQDLWQIHKKLM
jgi:hypothetical protein